EGECSPLGEPCAGNPWGCCPGCICIWQLTDRCVGNC
nr:Chain A, coffeetide [Coffea canephora]